jgi:hypothetical protein
MPAILHRRWTGDAIEMIGGLAVSVFLLLLAVSAATSPLVAAMAPRRQQ